MAQAYLLAKDRGVKIRAIDMDEESFTDFYVKNVSTVDLIVHSQRVKRVKRMRFRAKTAREFVLEWDSYINRTRGLRKVEKQRESTMAQNLAKLPRKYKRVLVLMDLERMEGVMSRFEELL
jgi:hypothetical protein